VIHERLVAEYGFDASYRRVKLFLPLVNLK